MNGHEEHPNRQSLPGNIPPDAQEQMTQMHIARSVFDPSAEFKAGQENDQEKPGKNGKES